MKSYAGESLSDCSLRNGPRRWTSCALRRKARKNIKSVKCEEEAKKRKKKKISFIHTILVALWLDIYVYIFVMPSCKSWHRNSPSVKVESLAMLSMVALLHANFKLNSTLLRWREQHSTWWNWMSTSSHSRYDGWRNEKFFLSLGKLQTFQRRECAIAANVRAKHAQLGGKKSESLSHAMTW